MAKIHVETSVSVGDVGITLHVVGWQVAPDSGPLTATLMQNDRIVPWAHLTSTDKPNDLVKQEETSLLYAMIRALNNV